MDVGVVGRGFCDLLIHKLCVFCLPLILRIFMIDDGLAILLPMARVIVCIFIVLSFLDFCCIRI